MHLPGGRDWPNPGRPGFELICIQDKVAIVDASLQNVNVRQDIMMKVNSAKQESIPRPTIGVSLKAIAPHIDTDAVLGSDANVDAEVYIKQMDNEFN